MVPLKPYADQPARATVQVVADVLAVVLLVVAYRVAVLVHDGILVLAVPGQKLQEAGSGLAGNLQDAASTVADLPLVGDRLRSALDGASGAATSLADVGQNQQDVVDDVARALGIVTFAVPLLLVVLLWFLPRLRFARRAGAAKLIAASGMNLELFALRALTRQPLPALARVSPDPVAAWRRGDVEVVRGLAALELRSSGVATPAAPGG